MSIFYDTHWVTVGQPHSLTGSPTSWVYCEDKMEWERTIQILRGRMRFKKEIDRIRPFEGEYTVKTFSITALPMDHTNYEKGRRAEKNHLPFFFWFLLRDYNKGTEVNI